VQRVKGDKWFVCECGNIIDPRAGKHPCGFYQDDRGCIEPHCCECDKNIHKDFLRYGLASLVTYLRVKYPREAMHIPVDKIYQRYLRIVSRQIGLIDKATIEVINKRFHQKRLSCGDTNLGIKFMPIFDDCIYHPELKRVRTIRGLFFDGFIDENQMANAYYILRTERILKNELNKSRVVRVKRSREESSNRRGRPRKS
jgi:hypothetical protein